MKSTLEPNLTFGRLIVKYEFAESKPVLLQESCSNSLTRPFPLCLPAPPSVKTGARSGDPMLTDSPRAEEPEVIIQNMCP